MGMGAEILEIGDHVYQYNTNGTLTETQVIDIIPIQGEYLTYNLVDMKTGTYLTNDIITHNTCFLPGTQINLGNGSYKNIENVELGEQVKVYNEQNQTIEDAPVSSTQTKIHNNVHEVILEDGTILQPTANHPFYTKEKGWSTISGLDEMGMGSSKLEVGDHVYSLQTNGTLQTIQITDIIPIEGDYLTYNLVDMQHETFLVEDTIVHNCCFLPGTQVNLADDSYKDIENIEIGDAVKVFNEETQIVEDAPVQSLQIKMHNDVHELHLQDGSILRPTANHPFYSKEKGWSTISGLDEMGMGTGKLEVGDYVYSLQPNGTLKEIQIVDIVPIEGDYLTYNLVDMKTGTYLAEDIVTHNSDCFLPGTPVSMADGTSKNIEDVEIGDAVKVYNEQNQTIENAPVQSLQIKMHNDVHELILEDGTILTPTANHPFYTKEKGWSTISGLDEMGMGAEKLQIGDHVYQLQPDGTLKENPIINIIPMQGNYLTYNFVDMKTGTYLADDVVTHNTCFLPGTPINLANGSYKPIEKIEIGDLVKVFDEDTKNVFDSPVTSIQGKIHFNLNELYLEDGKTLKVTANHPFYTANRRYGKSVQRGE